MSFVTFSIKLLLSTGRSKGPMTRNELVYENAMFNKVIAKSFDQTLNSPSYIAISLNVPKNRTRIL